MEDMEAVRRKLEQNDLREMPPKQTDPVEVMMYYCYLTFDLHKIPVKCCCSQIQLNNGAQKHYQKTQA